MERYFQTSFSPHLSSSVHAGTTWCPSHSFESSHFGPVFLSNTGIYCYLQSPEISSVQLPEDLGFVVVVVFKVAIARVEEWMHTLLEIVRTTPFRRQICDHY